MVSVTGIFDKEKVGGEQVVDDIISAYQFAANDEYRAVTHNKGTMNGIIAVANSTGQDSRAIEAAANAFAVKNGRYGSITHWSKDSKGNLLGKIEIPLSVGIVGGIINVHPMAKICSKILGVKSAQELSCVIASVGLAQNFSAMRALATDGIQKGHMKLHAKNLASAAGATPEQTDKIVQKMLEEKNISLNRAKELLEQI
jgi:hydroxymethylglutaryl-CoA reductase